MKESLISHQTTVQDKKPVKLKICLKSFGSKHYLNNHQRTVNENEKPFNCEICQKYFGGKGDMNRLQRTVHTPQGAGPTAGDLVPGSRRE